MKKNAKSLIVLVLLLAMTLTMTGNAFAATGNSIAKQTPPQAAQSGGIVMGFCLLGGTFSWSIDPWEPVLVIYLDNPNDSYGPIEVHPTAPWGSTNCYYIWGQSYNLTLCYGSVPVFRTTIMGW
jgi:hypothetical protein